MNVYELDLTSTMPQRALIQSRAQLAEAVDTVLGLARISLCCMHRNLEPLGLASARATQKLETAFKTHPALQVRLLVDDPHWLDTQAPRLRALHRHMTHALHLRCASESDPVAHACVIIVDQQHILDLEIGHLVKGDLWINHPLNAQSLEAAFDRRWEQAGYDLPAQPLGL
ncbi:MAG TPA: hypothetical protein PLQ67_07265 [Burkholderiaceae bacterium]|nr:hypothetical protein [Burkholderiaceae bacterium]